MRDRLRSLPSVHELAATLEGPRALRVTAARQAIDERRAQMRAGAELEGDIDRAIAARARALLADLERPSLRGLINATGVILHTNLGRAPLARAAREATSRAAQGYTNLELDLDTGTRGSRQEHVAGLICECSGAEAALAVNNGAAAVLLAVAALAGPGRAIVVSRGQLIEIGGGFRIPEVIAQSGSEMIEVGTANRTRREDYEQALTGAAGRVGAILRVHKSNFSTVGFVQDVGAEALCALGIPVIDDIGSGVVSSASAPLRDEPSLRGSLAAGATLVCCSGDKLLGGPQAGLVLGRSDAVAAARAHPLARALRIDKLALAALEATLMLYRDPERARREIPVLAMLAASERELGQRAARLRAAIGTPAQVVRATARVGGGALPLLELEGPAVAVAGDAEALVAALRGADPPVIARIHAGAVLLDPRTMTDAEARLVARAVGAALAVRGAG